jgi:hypothetical protein
MMLIELLILIHTGTLKTLRLRFVGTACIPSIQDRAEYSQIATQLEMKSGDCQNS